MRRVIVLSAILLLAACSKSAPQPSADRAGQPDAPAAAADAAAPPGATSASAGPSVPAPASGAPAAAPMLAYSYDYGVEAPAAQVRPLMTAQQQACVAAGPTVCQVTGANLATQDDQVTAKLTFRATPAWLKGYEDKLSDTARQAGGKLSHEEVTSEDLTHQIVDTDAAVKAKTALRDRLQALLETHPGNLADLLAVEQAVANAQADLDATTSNLTVMHERVAMSDVTIEYASGPGLSGPIVWLILLAVWTVVVGFAARAITLKPRPPKPVPSKPN